MSGYPAWSLFKATKAVDVQQRSTTASVSDVYATSKMQSNCHTRTAASESPSPQLEMGSAAITKLRLLGAHTYSVRAFCFGRRVCLSVCRLSVCPASDLDN